MPGPVADSAERLEALDPLRSFCVTAPAGSGKTELLIQRYLTLLARVALPQEVLAITFTRKAAAEMRSRIGEALAKASTAERPTDDHEALTYDLASRVLAADAERGWQLQENSSQLNIRTIDGFCGSLTRQMPVLSKFGGPIAAVDDAGPYYREASHGLLDLLEIAGGAADDLARVLLHFDNNWARLEEMLVSMLARRDQWLGSLGVGPDRERAQHAVEFSLAELCRESLSALDQALAPWRGELFGLLRYRNDCLGLEAVDEWPNHDPGSVPAWKSIVGLLLTNDGGWRKRRGITKTSGFPPGKGEADERKASMQDLVDVLPDVDGLLELLQEARRLPATGAGDEQWERVLACTRLLPLLAAELIVVFQKHGVVDHTQVSLAALEALGDDDRPTELALSLDYRLKHILVDEFQDTSVNQFELVRRLTRGWAEHNADNPEAARTLFIVGDGMQSIYGFREADVGLFIRAKQQGFDDLALESLTLKTNFRSRAGVVDWVNRTFTGAFPPADNIRRGEIAFSPAVAFQEADTDRPVQVMACDDMAVEAEWLAQRIAEGMAAEDCKSIAVLVRQRADLAQLVPALKRKKIAWQAQDIDPLSDSMVVRDLENLCRALHNPVDRAAWLALLRAPWCGLDNSDLLILARAADGVSLWSVITAPPGSISDDGQRRLSGLRAALHDILSRRERLPLRDWLEYAWLRLDGAKCVEEQAQLEDAEAFFSMLSALESAGEAYDPVTLQQHVQKLYASATSTDSKLQLMTLHKAKGLEFDWVFIPNLGRQGRGDSRELLLWDEYRAANGDRRFMLAMNDPTDDSASSLYDYLYEQRKNKRKRESTRLLYVGATRAVQRLWLSACLKTEEDGSWKAPSRGSLLHTIWEGVEAELRDIDTLPVPDQTPDELPHAPRLMRLAAPLASARDRPETAENEPNIPEWHTDQLAAAVGNLIHLTLERLSADSLPDSFDCSGFEDWWRRELNALGVGDAALPATLERAADSLSKVLADERGRWLLSPEREAAASELPLSCLLPDGRLGEFVIDRTFIADGERWVVDYKSSVPESTQSLEDFLAAEEARYRPQLENYARLLGAMEDRPVRCALYFTALPHWHELRQ